MKSESIRPTIKEHAAMMFELPLQLQFTDKEDLEDTVDATRTCFGCVRVNDAK